MQRTIVGYHQDDRGDWVAELDCGHQRHVRHDPPFQVREWVVDAEGREQRVGTLLECGLCAQDPPETRAGGESACFAHLVCPDCGVVLDGSPHRAGCPHARG